MASASVSLPVTCRKVTPSRSRMRAVRRASACEDWRRARRAARRARRGAARSPACAPTPRAGVARRRSGERRAISRPARPTSSIIAGRGRAIRRRSRKSALLHGSSGRKRCFRKTDRCGKQREILKHEADAAAVGRRADDRLPTNGSSPASGSSKPAMTRSSTVLPEPLARAAKHSNREADQVDAVKRRQRRHSASSARRSAELR